MELVNRTALTAAVQATEIHPALPRIAEVTAKATFRFDAEGKVELERDEPFPILAEDEKTELGLLPRDNLPRGSQHFEVILLGAAYAPPGRSVEKIRVRLSVGREIRELMVTGDRQWLEVEKRRGRRRISPPVPFERMPITYERAFGGSLDVLIDEDSPVTVSDGMNPLGRGFDASVYAEHLAKELKVPKGFPLYDKERPLPNVEDPNDLIQNWDDVPRPVGWATVPMESPIHAMRVVNSGAPLRGQEVSGYPPPEVMLRANPDWVIDLPERGAAVALTNLTPEGTLELRLPELRVLADYVFGDTRGSDELRPMMLVLLPETEQFYLVYRWLFQYPFEPTAERSIRLRVEQGWFEETGDRR